ncbi:MAG TPA: DUF502 domain-containing protein [Spirochaetota bacterium]|nr:DUF502 domain-containing protein [Spirochaetota bacterium]
MKDFLKKIQRTFFEGLVALLPLTLTVYITYYLIKFFYKIFSFGIPLLPEPFRDIFYFDFIIVVITVIIFFLLVFIIGFVTKTFLGRFIEKLIENAFISLPFVKVIYKAIKQLFTLFFSKEEGTKYSKIVLIEFPYKGKWAIAFLTGKCNDKFSPDKKKEYYTVFLPTTPNPTSGYLFILPKEDMIETQLTMDEALKLILSGGIIKE